MDCCKVGTVAEERNIAAATDEDVHEYLATRWLGQDDSSPKGFRTLAAWFNRQLLRAVYARHGRRVTDGRIENEYDALTGDDEVQKGEVIDDLQADGIDGDGLVSDFVSRSTMRRHLRDCLDASGTTTWQRGAPSDWEREQIQRSETHLKRKVRESVRSLDNKGELPGGTDADVDVTILLSCPECSTQVRLGTALEREFICPNHREQSSGVTSEAVNSTD